MAEFELKVAKLGPKIAILEQKMAMLSRDGGMGFPSLFYLPGAQAILKCIAEMLGKVLP